MRCQNKWRNQNLFDNREEGLEAYSALLVWRDIQAWFETKTVPSKSKYKKSEKN